MFFIIIVRSRTTRSKPALSIPQQLQQSIPRTQRNDDIGRKKKGLGGSFKKGRRAGQGGGGERKRKSHKIKVPRWEHPRNPIAMEKKQKPPSSRPSALRGPSNRRPKNGDHSKFETLLPPAFAMIRLRAPLDPIGNKFHYIDPISFLFF